MTTKELPHKRLLPLAAILALSLMLTTSNLLVHPAKAQNNYNVTILDLSFNPQVLCIEKGDTVVWTNNDSLIHALWFVFTENQSTYLLSDPIAPGESWSHAFTEPGELLYYDFKRLWITGKLRIYTIFGDVDGDGDVDRYDLGIFAMAYGSKKGDSNYNIECDFDRDGDVDRYDLGTFALNYGKKDP